MVSADNLNLDVLGLIFAFINSKYDQASIALVSRSFLAAVTPRLYAVLYYTFHEAKRYPTLMTPFATIISHPHLGVHVRHVDKPSLSNLRINGSMPTQAAQKLVQVRGLVKLAIDHGSWNLLDILPSWTSNLKQTLSSLTLSNCTEVNDAVLRPILADLPALTELNIISCSRFDHNHVLRLLHLTPNLEHLGFTLTDNSCTTDFLPFTLRRLRHLAFDTKCSTMASPLSSLVTIVMGHINSASPALTSFSAKLSDRLAANEFIEALVNEHGLTLRTLVFVGSPIAFTNALTRSFTLTTLVDLGDISHSVHSNQVSLTTDSAYHLMGHVRQLKKIVSGGRTWTGKRGQENELTVTLDRRRAYRPEKYWFQPRD
ncbi:hypothetical protein PC9H_000512 [Pleurotus ostreatus]|uniref:F-box domain-containing protein n=1 Tax=Pleurotus ostreatus TaxID=5322 RepID=A0A8H7DXV8_PLEOS|nr:uncharacterized protein PC9H_000512 [Pleurotus ostreatus]KAF7440168.1 hypothetical protein PC9H_000512 [Pleurotus ostreatus]